ncbi:MAG: hypothetical protein VYA34_06745 [Myxococcota bacterium]|nr:hypothetical protein [Myxococcota bacterium]
MQVSQEKEYSPEFLASILAQVQEGELSLSSPINDPTYGDHATLGEHPELVKAHWIVTQMRDQRTLQKMLNSQWPADQDLVKQELGLGRSLVELAKERRVGYLFIHSAGTKRIISISAGIPTQVVSSHHHETFLNTLSHRLDTHELEKVLAHSKDSAQSLAYVLLKYGIFSLDKLLEELTLHTRIVLAKAIRLEEVETIFVDSPSAASIFPAGDINSLELARMITQQWLQPTLLTKNALPFLKALGDETFETCTYLDAYSSSLIFSESEKYVLQNIENITSGILEAEFSAATVDNIIEACLALSILGLVKPGLLNGKFFHQIAQNYLTQTKTALKQETTNDHSDRKILMAKTALQRGDLKVAHESFAELAIEGILLGESLAYQAYCLDLQNPSQKPTAQQTAIRALEKDPYSPIVHAVLAHLFRQQSGRGKFKFHRSQALRLTSDNPAKRQEVLLIIDAQKKHSLVQENSLRKIEEAPFLITAVLISLFAVGVLFRGGQNEDFISSTPGFFWFRTLLLAFCAYIGFRNYTLKPDLVWTAKLQFGGRPPLVYVAAGILYGAILGNQLMTQPIEGALSLWIPLIILRTTAEHLFLVVFGSQVINQLVDDQRWRILAVGVLYGLYQLTFYSVWTSGFQLSTVLPTFAIGVIFQGSAYAWLFTKSRHLLPSWLTHNLAVLITVFRSL